MRTTDDIELPVRPGDQRTTTPATRRPADTLPALTLTLAFLCVGVIGILHHELWRDEWQAWMIARDSATLADLFRNVQDERHAPGWFVVLFALSRFTRDAAAMQFAHLALATASVFLLARHAPLPWLHKTLIAFGYFLAYEYAIVARPYAVGILALFAFCALYPQRQRHPVLAFIPLAVLATASIFGIIIAFAAAGALILEFATRPAHAGPVSRLRWHAGVSVVVICLAIGGSLLVMRPPDGFPQILANADAAFSRWAVASTLATLTRAYLPIPDLSEPGYWSTFFLGANTWSTLAVSALLALVIGAGALLVLARRPFVLFLFVAGTAGLLLFRHLVFTGTMRHHGHLFVLFLACLWLAALPGHEWRVPRRLARWTGIGRRARTGFVLGVLGVQVAVAAVLYTADLRRPFSPATEAAAYLRSEGLDGLPIGVSPAGIGASLAGALDRPIHYLAFETDGTFIRWEGYPRRRDRNFRMELARPFLDRTTGDVLLILGAAFADWDEALDVTELARFPAGLVGSEAYVIYRVRTTQP